MEGSGFGLALAVLGILLFLVGAAVVGLLVWIF